MFFNGPTQSAFDAFIKNSGVGPSDIRLWRRFVISLHQAGGSPDMWYVRHLLEEELGPDRAEFYIDLLQRDLDSLRISTIRITR